MSGARKLATAARLARRREHEAARELREKRAGLALMEQRSIALEQYRDGYLDPTEPVEGTAGRASLLANRERFMRQLDLAIDGACVQAGRADSECERDRQAWSAMRSRVKAIDKVVAKKIAIARQSSRRREETALDECITSRWGNATRLDRESEPEK